MELKPTNKKPLGKMGKKLEKQFSTNLKGSSIDLKEVDSMLSEKEQSFKKKFWDLPKMESLVHSDPILSAEYQEMSEDGQEKYGYHYNETIMNMLFNKYVTNDQGYQQKYLNAIPAKKERRDKSGIHQLQQKGEEKMEKRQKNKNENNVPIHNNSLEGVIEEEMMDNNLNTDGGGTFDDREYLNHRTEKRFDTMKENTNQSFSNDFASWFTSTSVCDVQHPEFGKHKVTPEQIKNSPAEYKNNLFACIKKNIDNGTITQDMIAQHSGVDETTGAASSGAFSGALGAKNNVYEGEDMDLNSIKAKAKQISKEEGVAQHVNKVGNNYKISDWYDDETTVASFENGRPLNEDKRKDDPCWKDYKQVGMKDKNGKEVPNCVPEGKEMNEVHGEYDAEKEMEKAEYDSDFGKDPSWDQLDQLEKEKEKEKEEDVNETTTSASSGAYVGPFRKKGKNHVTDKPAWEGGKIIEENYLTDSSFFKNLHESINQNYSVAGLAEHHLESREEKINFILQNNKGGFTPEMLNDVTDEGIDSIYRDLESDMNMGESENIEEKSVSKNQQQFMGMVHAHKKGEMPDASDAVKKAAASMSDEDALDFASTKHKGLPNKVEEDSKYIGNLKLDTAMQLANQIDNAPVEEEEQVIMNFLEGKEMSQDEFRNQVQNLLDKMAGSESPEFFKLQYLLTVVNDMIDQVVDVKRQQDKDQAMRDYYRTPHGKAEKMASMGESEQMDESLQDTVQYDSERSGEEPFELNGEKWQYVNAIYPDGKKDIGVYRYGHDLVYSYDWFNNVVLGHDRGKDVEEGMLNTPDSMSMASSNATSMANTMKGGMSMGEGTSPDKIDMARKDNELSEFGTSEEGYGGFNEKGEGTTPNYKNPDAYGAPRDKELNKYNKMTEGKEPVCENCGSPLDEDGHCRRDEVPVAGKIAGEKGSCKKKDTDTKAKDNKFNVEFRKKKEKERLDKIENKFDDDKELDKSKKQMKKLKEMVEGKEVNEDKKPSTLVQLDRLQKDNEKNFKSDLKNSNTADVADDELTAKEQVEEVGDNPYELAEKIEKEKQKEHKFESLDNVGNSTNDNNKEIPKRNATDEEAEDIMKDRGLGMQDIVYDNKPDERFEERMEKDMGEKIYKQRQDKMEYRAEAPMYNKDSQPIDDGQEKAQFDKDKSKYNSRKGVNENQVISAKYKDEFGRRKVISFNINEAVEVEKAEGVSLSFDGMGNTYTQRVTENTEMRDLMNRYKYFISGGNKIVKVATGRQSLTENNDNTNEPINEEVKNMMRLSGYDPSKHVNTSSTKKNRGF